MQTAPEQLAAIRSFKAGETIVSEYSEWARMYVVESGTVALYRTGSTSRSFLMELAGPGRVFGNLVEAGLTMTRSRAIAVTDTEVSVVSGESFQQMVRARPGFLGIVLESNARRTDYLACRLEETANESVRVRVARMVLGLISDSGEPGTSTLNITHQVLADLLGVTRQSVSEELEQLDSSGHLKLSRGKITVVDREALDEVAKFSFACQPI